LGQDGELAKQLPNIPSVDGLGQVRMADTAHVTTFTEEGQHFQQNSAL
jgi:hypothetical protein